MKNFSLNYFDKQPPLPHFRAIGNDEGLFIVVPENRFWFATRSEAKVYSSEITFTHNNKVHKLILPK
ncbi:MAG TPA: hypothetical protein VIJ92_15260 [Ginsengibacter sp.]